MASVLPAVVAAAKPLMPTLYLSHGGGPCFFFDKREAPMFDGMDKNSESAKFLRNASKDIPKPRAILIVSGHWEASVPTVMTSPRPPMYFDYYGFPEASYKLSYPAPGSPELAAQVSELLRGAGIETASDSKRGFDHGVFVPLMLMYPDADVPIMQLSLKSSLNPSEHLRIGAALAPLRADGVLIIGSGAAVHNFGEMGRPGVTTTPPRWAKDFIDWVDSAVSEPDLETREHKLAEIDKLAPNFRRAHPRSEHLMPLLVVAGAAVTPEGTISAGRKIHDVWVMESFSQASYRFD